MEVCCSNPHFCTHFGAKEIWHYWWFCGFCSSCECAPYRGWKWGVPRCLFSRVRCSSWNNFDCCCNLACQNIEVWGCSMSSLWRHSMISVPNCAEILQHWQGTVHTLVLSSMIWLSVRFVLFYNLTHTWIMHLETCTILWGPFHAISHTKSRVVRFCSVMVSQFCVRPTFLMWAWRKIR